MKRGERNERDQGEGRRREIEAESGGKRVCVWVGRAADCSAIQGVVIESSGREKKRLKNPGSAGAALTCASSNLRLCSPHRGFQPFLSFVFLPVLM